MTYRRNPAVVVDDVDVMVRTGVKGLHRTGFVGAFGEDVGQLRRTFA